MTKSVWHISDEDASEAAADMPVKPDVDKLTDKWWDLQLKVAELERDIYLSLKIWN